jgi:hypothetical protein
LAEPKFDNELAGVLPDEKILSEMGKYNYEMVKADVLLSTEGLDASSRGVRVKFSGGKRTCDRRALRRDEGADRWLLADPGEIKGRGDPAPIGCRGIGASACTAAMAARSVSGPNRRDNSALSASVNPSAT